MRTRPQLTYILILNWNGWCDTLECLESVFRNDHPEYHVVVCDNDSSDRSVERITAWAEGRLDTWTFPGNCLRSFSWPPVPKPIPYSVLTRGDAERPAVPQPGERLTIIGTGSNLGFAGGNNVGLRYIMARGDHGFVWLLNNDTVVRPDALSRMLQRLQEKPAAGICGSTLMYYDQPDLIQGRGGARYNRFLGIIRYIDRFSRQDAGINADAVERQMSYVAGASMLVSRSFLESVGLMNESFFLYFEELDWCARAKGKFAMAYAPLSLVYHKEGSSIGTASRTRGNSVVSDYYALSNRIKFTRLHYPLLLPTIYLALLVALVNRLRRGQPERAVMILRILIGDVLIGDGSHFRAGNENRPQLKLNPSPIKSLLCITAFAPGDKTAGQAFTLRLIKDIARDHCVDLCFFHEDRTAPEVVLPNVNVLFAERLTLFRRILGAISVPWLHPLFTSRFRWGKMRYLRSIAQNYDAVYFDFSQVFIYALFIQHRHKIALAHDIITQMYERRDGIPARLHALFSKLSERVVMKRLGARLYCFSEKDCGLVKTYFGAPAEKVDFYLDERIYELALDAVVQHNKFVFYGAWSRRENSSGLLWFIADVLPLLDANCRFVVIGSGVNEDVREAAQVFGDAVEFVGFVDNPYALLAGARALVAPLFEGAGVKVKVLEALACGTPVVGTEISFEGIDEKLLVHCHRCTSAAAFANELNTFIPQDRQQARAAFLADYPRNTMGGVLRRVCQSPS